MSAPDVMALARKFLRDEEECEDPRLTSVEAIEPDSKWKVLANVGEVGVVRRELVIDDRDGKIVSYKQL